MDERQGPQPDDPVSSQASHLLLGIASALNSFGLAENRYEFTLTDQHGNSIEMKGTMRAEATSPPDYGDFGMPPMPGG